MSHIEEAEFVAPASLDEALKLLADEKTRGTLLAGGSDLMVQWEAGVRPPPVRVISVKSVPELRAISEEPGHVVIGAAVTHWEIRHAPLIKTFAPSLSDACATVGGAQIQELGTIAGSIANASPAGDIAPSLLVADASVVVASARGEREMPLIQFMKGYKKIDLQPDEMIARFRVPKLPAGGREAWRKLGPRAAQAISKVMGSYRGRMKDGLIESFAVALGSVGPTAIRIPAVESHVAGKAPSPQLFAEAERIASDFVQPISDIRSTAEYRKWVSGRIVRMFLEDLAG